MHGEEFEELRLMSDLQSFTALLISLAATKNCQTTKEVSAISYRWVASADLEDSGQDFAMFKGVDNCCNQLI